MRFSKPLLLLLPKNTFLNSFFKVTITEAANDTYGGRSGAHDDIVLAVAPAAWKAEAYVPPTETRAHRHRTWIDGARC